MENHHEPNHDVPKSSPIVVMLLFVAVIGILIFFGSKNSLSARGEEAKNPNTISLMDMFTGKQ